MVIVLEHQTLADIALQEYGTVNSIVALAKANNISVTETLLPGQKLLVPELIKDRNIVTYYDTNNIKPATSKDIRNTLKFPTLFRFGLFESNLFA